MGPVCAAPANGPPLEIVPGYTLWNLVSVTRHAMAAHPALHLDVRGPRLKQLI